MGRNSDEGDEEDRVLGRGMTSDNLQADEKTGGVKKCIEKIEDNRK